MADVPEITEGVCTGNDDDSSCRYQPGQPSPFRAWDTSALEGRPADTCFVELLRRVVRCSGRTRALGQELLAALSLSLFDVVSLCPSRRIHRILASFVHEHKLVVPSSHLSTLSFQRRHLLVPGFMSSVLPFCSACCFIFILSVATAPHRYITRDYSRQAFAMRTFQQYRCGLKDGRRADSFISMKCTRQNDFRKSIVRVGVRTKAVLQITAAVSTLNRQWLRLVDLGRRSLSCKGSIVSQSAFPII